MHLYVWNSELKTLTACHQDAFNGVTVFILNRWRNQRLQTKLFLRTFIQSLCVNARFIAVANKIMYAWRQRIQHAVFFLVTSSSSSTSISELLSAVGYGFRGTPPPEELPSICETKYCMDSSVEQVETTGVFWRNTVNVYDSTLGVKRMFVEEIWNKRWGWDMYVYYNKYM